MAAKTIEEMKNAPTNSIVAGTFVIFKCEYKTFKAKPGQFLQCELSDRTGVIKGIVWDSVDVFKIWLKNKMVVQVAGDLTRYNDIPQLVIKDMREAKEFDIAQLVPSLPSSLISEKTDRLVSLMKTIKNPECSHLLQRFFFLFPNELSSCPGGLGAVHHNYLGGLLEHTLSLMEIADHYCRIHSGLDRDILLTGCMFHDIGKIQAYRWDKVMEMTDKGRLLHHIPLGYQMLVELCNLSGVDENCETVLRLKHIIVSHHDIEGCTKPMTPEALAVSAIDNMDATINHAMNYIGDAEKQKEEGNWTAYCNLTQRSYYCPKPEAPIPEEEPKPRVKKAEDTIV